MMIIMMKRTDDNKGDYDNTDYDHDKHDNDDDMEDDDDDDDDDDKKKIKKLILFRVKSRRIPQSWAPITVSPRPHSLLTTFLFTTLYTRLTVLIIDEVGKPENPEKNPRVMRKNNTLNKLSSHMTRAGIEPGSQR